EGVDGDAAGIVNAAVEIVPLMAVPLGDTQHEFATGVMKPAADEQGGTGSVVEDVQGIDAGVGSSAEESPLGAIPACNAARELSASVERRPGPVITDRHHLDVTDAGDANTTPCDPTPSHHTPVDVPAPIRRRPRA